MLKVKEERQCLVCLQFKDILEFPRICGGGNACTPRQHICRACKKVACNAATKAKHSAAIRRRDRDRKRKEAERIRALGYGKGNGGWSTSRISAISMPSSRRCGAWRYLASRATT